MFEPIRDVLGNVAGAIEDAAGDGPHTFDEVTRDDRLSEMDADFVPLPQAGAQAGDRHDIDPYQYHSLQAQEAFDAAVAAAMAGEEERAVQEFLRASKIAETAREWHLAAVSCQRVGEFLATPTPPYDLERALRMYRRAIAGYEQCGLFAEARELAYCEMCLKLRRSRELRLPLMHVLELLLFWATAGFGFRPLRVIGTAVFLVVAYGLLYWVLNGVT